jgi:hypothetical protein
MSKLTLLEKARETAPYPGPPCDVMKALVAHPDLADEISALIQARDVSHKGAAKAFSDAGIDISHNVVSRHRANECRNCKKNGRIW